MRIRAWDDDTLVHEGEETGIVLVVAVSFALAGASQFAEETWVRIVASAVCATMISVLWIFAAKMKATLSDLTEQAERIHVDAKQSIDLMVVGHSALADYSTRCAQAALQAAQALREQGHDEECRRICSLLDDAVAVVQETHPGAVRS